MTSTFLAWAFGVATGAAAVLSASQLRTLILERRESRAFWKARGLDI